MDVAKALYDVLCLCVCVGMYNHGTHVLQLTGRRRRQCASAASLTQSPHNERLQREPIQIHERNQINKTVLEKKKGKM